MASEQQQMAFTLLSEADLSSQQYRCMIMVNQGYATTSLGGSTDNFMGILGNAPAARDRACKIIFGGHTKMIAGQAISTLGYIGLDSDGSVKSVANDGYTVVGRNLQLANGSGEFIEALLFNSRY